MNLDNLYDECRQLSDRDLKVLLDTMMREQKERNCREKKAAWKKVCDAIAHYTANYGNIRVADFSGDEDTEICLQHGQFAFSEYGDIEVGA
jgi:hypothetical protein